MVVDVFLKFKIFLWLFNFFLYLFFSFFLFPFSFLFFALRYFVPPGFFLVASVALFYFLMHIYRYLQYVFLQYIWSAPNAFIYIENTFIYSSSTSLLTIYDRFILFVCC